MQATGAKVLDQAGSTPSGPALPGPAYKYKAFISYSHDADGRLAAALHSALHQFNKPWYQVRALRLFRDETDISTNPGLWPTLQKAMSESEFFLLLASSEAAKPGWVNDEVEFWLEHRPDSLPLVVVTSGDIAEDKRGGFSSEKTTCLPPCLRGKFQSEPTYVDLRWVRQEKEMPTLKDPRFLDGVAELASTLTGKEKAVLVGEDVRKQRKARRLAWSAVAVLLALTFASIWLGLAERRAARAAEDAAEKETDARIVAMQRTISETGARKSAEAARKSEGEARREAETALGREKEARGEAEERRREAELQARIANARRLATHAAETLERFPQRSLLLAVEALRRSAPQGPSRVVAAEQTLWNAVAATGGRRLEGSIAREDAAAFSGDGRWLAVAGLADHDSGRPRGVVRLWDLTAPAVTAPSELAGNGEPLVCVALSEDGSWLIAGGEGDSALLWRLGKGPLAQPVLLPGHPKGVYSVAFSLDNRWVATGDKDGRVRVWDLADPAHPPRAWAAHSSSITKIAFGIGSKWLVSTDSSEEVRLWNLESDAPGDPVLVREASWARSRFTPPSIALSPNHRFLVADLKEDRLAFWDLAEGAPAASRCPRQADQDQAWGRVLAVDDECYRLVTRSNVNVVVAWELLQDRVMSKTLENHGQEVNTAALSRDGRWLATAGLDKAVRIWDFASSALHDSARVLRAHDEDARLVLFSPDARWLLTASGDGLDGAGRLWDLRDRILNPVMQVLQTRERGSIGYHVSSPDGRWLVLRDHGYPKKMDLFDLDGEDPTSGSTMSWDADLATPAAFSSDLRWWVTAEERAMTFRNREGVAIQTSPLADGELLWPIRFSPDSRWLAAINAGGGLRLWDVRGPRPVEVALASKVKNLSGTSLVAFSENGRWLLAGDTLLRLDPGPPRPFPRFPQGPGAGPGAMEPRAQSAQSAAFSSDGRWLAVGGSLGGLWLFDLSSPDPMASPVVVPGHTKMVNVVAFSPDNRWLATGSQDYSALLFDLRRGLTAMPFALRGPESFIWSMAVSRDSRWLVAGSDDGSFYLWDLTADRPASAPLVFDTGGGRIEQVAFDRAQRALLTVGNGGGGKVVSLWPLSLTRLEEMARLTAGRNLTPWEWDQYFPGEPYRPTFESLAAPPPRPAVR